RRSRLGPRHARLKRIGKLTRKPKIEPMPSEFLCAAGSFRTRGPPPLMLSFGRALQKRERGLTAIETPVEKRPMIIHVLPHRFRQLFRGRKDGERFFILAYPVKKPRGQKADLRPLAEFRTTGRQIKQRRLIARAPDERLEVVHRVGRIGGSKRDGTGHKERDQHKKRPHS